MSRYRRYLEYLHSPEWRAKRAEAFAFYGRFCNRCRRADVLLHVHHKTYARLFAEDVADLEVLCSECHREEHQKAKKPKAKKLKVRKLRGSKAGRVCPCGVCVTKKVRRAYPGGGGFYCSRACKAAHKPMRAAA